MIRKTVEIATAGTRLSIAHRQLVIERPEHERRTLPCEDIGVLVVDHPQVSYTHPVFTTLLDEGAAIVLCGANHLPAGLLLPFDAHGTQTERHRAQTEAGDGVKTSAVSLCRMLTDNGKELILPEGLPVGSEDGEAPEADDA